MSEFSEADRKRIELLAYRGAFLRGDAESVHRLLASRDSLQAEVEKLRKSLGLIGYASPEVDAHTLRGIARTARAESSSRLNPEGTEQ